MVTQQINVQRWSVISKKPFESVVAAVGAAVGHPNMGDFTRKIAASKTYAQMEEVVQAAVGKTGLMEFARFDIGTVLARAHANGGPKSVRLVLGNPLIMQSMVRHVPDAGSYAPVTVLVDERPDGVHLTYDEMVSLLAPYGNPQALEVARDLDAR